MNIDWKDHLIVSHVVLLVVSKVRNLCKIGYFNTDIRINQNYFSKQISALHDNIADSSKKLGQYPISIIVRELFPSKQDLEKLFRACSASLTQHCWYILSCILKNVLRYSSGK